MSDYETRPTGMLANNYQVIYEDIIENVFITLAISFFFESKHPTFRKASIITIVTIFYWIFIYKFFRPIILGL